MHPADAHVDTHAGHRDDVRLEQQRAHRTHDRLEFEQHRCRDSFREWSRYRCCVRNFSDLRDERREEWERFSLSYFSAANDQPRYCPRISRQLRSTAPGLRASFTQVDDGTGQPAKYDIRFARPLFPGALQLRRLAAVALHRSQAQRLEARLSVKFSASDPRPGTISNWLHFAGH